MYTLPGNVYTLLLNWQRGVIMTNNKNLGVRVDDEMRHKIKYIATYHGRSVNNLVVRLIAACIRDFEAKNGPIPTDEHEPS